MLCIPVQLLLHVIQQRLDALVNLLPFPKDSLSQVQWQKHSPSHYCISGFKPGVVLDANHILTTTSSFHPGSQGCLHPLLCTSSLELQPAKHAETPFEGAQPPWIPEVGLPLNWPNKSNK